MAGPAAPLNSAACIPVPRPKSPGSGGYQGALAAYERQLIEAGLKETGGNISEASRLLRLSLNALKVKIRSYGL